MSADREGFRRAEKIRGEFVVSNNAVWRHSAERENVIQNLKIIPLYSLKAFNFVLAISSWHSIWDRVIASVSRGSETP
jgi:hypothetical protein